MNTKNNNKWIASYSVIKHEINNINQDEITNY